MIRSTPMDDRYTDDDFYNYPFPSFTDNHNKFARASLILGMCSIVLVCTLFLPIPLGALGLLFYFLSKRLHKPVDSSAKAGLVTSLIGLCAGLIFMGFTVYSSVQLLKPENRDVLNAQFESLYGVDFDEYINRLYGEE